MVQTARADVSSSSDRGSPSYKRHRPERSTLYEVVRDNLETLYGAIDEGALDVKVSKHARKRSLERQYDRASQARPTPGVSPDHDAVLGKHQPTPLVKGYAL